MKILDCTLRDGGYYTDWDFNDNLVNNYLDLAKHLPIDIVEVGYRGNRSKKSYFGEYYFLTKTKLQNIKKKIGKKTKISIMIDLKDWKTPKELELNLKDCTSCVDIIRFAVNPGKLSKINKYLEITKKLGFTVAVNLMYVHLSLKDEKIISDEKWVAGIYTDAIKRLADNEDLQEEVDTINQKLEDKSDKAITELWKKTREFSIKSWDKIYDELNTKFDKHYFESEV